MASVDMAPLCSRCHLRHWPNTSHYGPARRRLHRIGLRLRWLLRLP